MQIYFVKDNKGAVNLLDKDNNITNFENAYIIYNGEKIDVTDCIMEYKENILVAVKSVAKKLERLEKVEDMYDLSGTTQTFELVKDGVSYFGNALMTWNE